MTQHVLLISLGPVQDFITSARRCRDLWFGSWILSELAKAAAAGIVDALGGDRAALDALVFPAAQDRSALGEGSAMSVANKLVVRVTGDDKRVHDVAEAGRIRMGARRDALREGAFKRIGNGDPRRDHHFLTKPARQQVDELFEYLWVAVAEVEGEAGYVQARTEAERLLGARKNARTWKQPSWASEGAPKSSLDGVRESVLHEDIYERGVTGPRREPSLTPEQRRTRYGVHGSERLCGVGLLKRWGVQLDAEGARSVERFFSTAHLAALPTMIGIAEDASVDQGIGNAWRDLRTAAGPATEDLQVVPGRRTGLFGNTDGAILFAQRLVETLADCGHAPESEVTRAALVALKKFSECTGRGEPLPYYVILVADGDRMGAVIDAQATPKAHRELSTALDAFAGSARGIVDSHHGCLIYSGGDDVLAFLPLHEAVECAEKLAQAFASRLAPWKAKDGTSATLSAGLAIVHYIDPMGAALEVAREAERTAKRHPGTKDRPGKEDRPGKDALAIALDKRSGTTITVCDHWDKLAPRLARLVALHQADEVPDKAGYELAELARLADDADPEALLALRPIQRSEALRILGRKRAQRGQEKIDQKDLAEHLGEDPAVLGRELVIAALIAKAKSQAAPRAKEGT